MEKLRLFHISEDSWIEIFKPRPSPSHYDSIKADVVFAVSEKLVHNYLLPRDCARVTYYAGINTSNEELNLFFGETKAEFIIVVELGWLERIKPLKFSVMNLIPNLFLFWMSVQDIISRTIL